MWTRLALLAALLFARNAMAQEGDATYRGYVGAAASGSFDVQVSPATKIRFNLTVEAGRRAFGPSATVSE